MSNPTATAAATIVESLTDGILTATVVETSGNPSVRIGRTDGAMLGTIDFGGETIEIAGVIANDVYIPLARRITTRNRELRTDLRIAVRRIAAEHVTGAEADRIDTAMMRSAYQVR